MPAGREARKTRHASASAGRGSRPLPLASLFRPDRTNSRLTGGHPPRGPRSRGASNQGLDFKRLAASPSRSVTLLAGKPTLPLASRGR